MATLNNVMTGAMVAGQVMQGVGSITDAASQAHLRERQEDHQVDQDDTTNLTNLAGLYNSRWRGITDNVLRYGSAYRSESLAYDDRAAQIVQVARMLALKRRELDDRRNAGLRDSLRSDFQTATEAGQSWVNTQSNWLDARVRRRRARMGTAQGSWDWAGNFMYNMNHNWNRLRAERHSVSFQRRMNNVKVKLEKTKLQDARQRLRMRKQMLKLSGLMT